ncbi:MAG: Zn-ribbon domain-containing OB-fold protein [Bryobacteraceae bacterium]
MKRSESGDGIVYTETIVHSPPEQFAADAPYQVAIIDVEGGRRVTVRILGKQSHERARIGDRVTFVEERNGVAYYRRLA